MAKPTKEECQVWLAWVEDTRRERRQPHQAELGSLWDWLSRVAAALPTAAAVQRDLKRMKYRATPRLCPGCGQIHLPGVVCYPPSE